MGAPTANDNQRTIFLGVVVAILILGFITEKTGTIKNGVEYAFYLILAYTVITAFNYYKARAEKRRLDENARKVEEQRRLEEERRRQREERLMEELYGKNAGKKSKKEGDEKEPVAEEIKGEHYAKIVAAAFKRLGYEVTYRDIHISEDDAVHLIATRANEICLIHCSKNQGEVTRSEIELFALDCAAFFRRHKFWQDDVRYVFALMSMISEKAIDYIDAERKRNVPIEYRVISV